MVSTMLPFLLCSLVFLPIYVIAQTKNNITIGDSLIAETNTSPWLISQSSGDFAFGFYQLEGTDFFLLSIWYAKIPDKTIVWYANGDKPAPKGSKVELTAKDGLILTSPNGEQLWTNEGLISDKVSHGVLNDTGNFVLEDGNFTSLWETFKDPRDTLLPSQVVEKDGKLSSRLKETNFNKGRFVLFLRNDGNLAIYTINLPSGYVNEGYISLPYMGSGNTGTNTSGAGTKLVFDRSGELYVLGENNKKYNVLDEESKVSTTQFYLRATLHFDGVFILHKHPKSSTNGSWTPVLTIPDNICVSYVTYTGSGICGYNSYCSLGPDKRPICQCPKRFSLVDPNDPYGSCKPDFIQGCEEDELSGGRGGKDLYDYEVLINTDWPLSDSVLQTPFTEEQCKQACMEDCMCSAAIFRLGDHCWKKKFPLSNGKVDVALNGGKAFLKVRKEKMKRNQF